MHSLPVLLRLSGRPVILAGTGAAADAKRVLLERAGAIICPEEDEAALAIVAIEDDAEALAAIARLKARGVLVNATDRADMCDFTLPAIVDRDPVLVAIGTGGASAGLAKALRQRLEALLPQALGQVARMLFEARSAIRARWPDAADRRRAIDAALSPGGALDPFCLPAPDAVDRLLAAPDSGHSSGVITLALASNDPDDLTLRQARLMGQADVIVAGADIAPDLLARARADAVRMPELPDPPPVGLVLHLVRKTD